MLPPEADYSGIARNNEVRRNPGRAGNPALADPDVATSLFCQSSWLPRLFSPSPEPDPADLQLRHREPDPLSQLRSGQPDEVRNQCKDPTFVWHLTCHRDFLKAVVRGAPQAGSSRNHGNAAHKNKQLTPQHRGFLPFVGKYCAPSADGVRTAQEKLV